MYEVVKITKELEEACFDKYEQTKNLQDLEPVLKAIYRFIDKVINGRSIGYFDSDDLVQECYLDILNKIHKFDRSKGYRVTTYFGSPLFIKGILSHIYRFCNRKIRGGDFIIVSSEISLIGEEINLIDNIEDPTSIIEDNMLKSELIDKLYESIDSMHQIPKERLYKYIRGSKPKEIGCTPKNINGYIKTLTRKFNKKVGVL